MREFFHVPENYFLTHSVGCMPKSTLAHVTEGFYQPWQNMGGQAWDQWLSILLKFREGIAELVATSGVNVCPQTNISSALTKIIYSFPQTKERNVIVLSEHDFPTIGFVLKQAVNKGYTLRFVKGDITCVENWSEAIKDDVQWVHITHALSNTSQLLPVVEICALARAKGAMSIVDIAQSAGIVDVDTENWQPDFMTGTSVKFICGGPGACFLYASPDMTAKADPIDVGWFSHENPFEMDIHHFEPAHDAMRFFGGTPSPAPFAAAAHALDIWQRCGFSGARNRVQDYLNALVEVVPNQALISPKDKSVRGGTLVVKSQTPDHLENALIESSIIFDKRPDGFRFSVHGYTSEIEIDCLRNVLIKNL